MTKHLKCSTNKAVSGVFKSIPYFVSCWFSVLSEFIAYLVVFFGGCLRSLTSIAYLVVFSGGCKFSSSRIALSIMFSGGCLCSLSSIAYLTVFSIVHAGVE